MRTVLSAFCLILLTQSALEADGNPKSKKTRWRIPSNAAVTAVGTPLKWKVGEHPDGAVTLETGLGEHHSYEQAWAYYAHMFGMTTDYDADARHQTVVVDGDKRTATENDRDQIFKAGRWTRMHGKFGRYKTSLSLWDDPGLAKQLGRAYAVALRIRFEPE